jgi:Family of unknown function (DUF5956)
VWECIEVTQPTDEWAELDETGWDAVIAWFVGPPNLGRFPNSDAGRTVSVTCVRGGVVEQFEEVFTEDDRRTVDETIDEYLVDAGIPPRPRGYRWFIRVPSAHTSAEAFHDDVHKAINSAEAPGTAHPANWCPLIETVVRRFYP